MGHEVLAPNPWMILPFGVLLGAIALGPLLFADWWGKHYPKVAYGLGAVTLGYYLLWLREPGPVWHAARDYLSFILLLGSLYVVAGGIHLRVKGEATPWVNVCFLLVGAVSANFLGTTGAAMLLIRPWLRMNQYRVTAHHVVFFIFLVANVGGCLTPVGDPPLFLGFLNGIPFWWVAEHCWPAWLLAVGMLLIMFYLIDRHNYLRAPAAVRERLAEPADHWHFDGGSNLWFLALILAAAFIKRPPFVREGLMAVAAVGSWLTTRKSIHEANHFNFHPIIEVAVLFVGIFATMLPALQWLELNAGKVGMPTAGVFYWATGTLSSVLDNAPTYLSFLSALFGAVVDPQVVAQVQHALQVHGAVHGLGEPARQTWMALQKYFSGQLAAHQVGTREIEVAFLLGNPTFNGYLVAISLGAVFFGANTYIGNGPNFMVKAIADHRKVHTPGFLGYLFRYALPCMLPTLLAVWWVFFRS
jgi:Na+/H+ antiporter NhaD/arsenite permease-like protein